MLSVAKLLNPDLFAALKRRFKNVKVSNEGIPMHFQLVEDSAGKKRAEVIQSGEYYRVCCPHCNDQRFRVYVNHRYGTHDPATGVRFGHFLVHCFNEQCDMRGFDEELKVYLHKGVKISSPPGPISTELTIAPLPGECVPLGALKPDGEVLQYLQGRRFDPYVLEEKYYVGFCYEGAEDYPLMTGRIVIPIYYGGILVGWQGRLPRDDASIKYYTMPGFSKSRILYNHDRASKKPLVVVCEGVADVWRVGDCGVCAFGHDLSHYQSHLIFSTWKNGAVALCFDSQDSDAQDKACRWVEKNKEACAGGVANIVLPKDDPADMGEEELWTEIYNQCTQQGVKITL